MSICLVSKGRSPTGRIERITALQSCYQLQLNPADFGNMPKNMFPIVIAYNGRDHFVPTIPCSEKDYLAWKVHKEFGSLAVATLLVTKELDRPSLPAGAAQGIKAIEKAIEDNLPKISKKAFQYYNTLARRTTTHRGPAVQVAGSVPGTAGSSSSHQPPGPSTSSASQGAAEQEEQVDIPKGYKCDHCGKLCQRKPDLRAICGLNIILVTQLFVTWVLVTIKVFHMSHH